MVWARSLAGLGGERIRKSLQFVPIQPVAISVLVLICWISGAKAFADDRQFKLGPSSPLTSPMGAQGRNTGNQSLEVSSRMLADILPSVPGLEFTYLHSFGKWDNWSRLIVDYTGVVKIDENKLFFGEAQAILHDFWYRTPWDPDGRFDLSVGGGYRRRIGTGHFLGVNAYYDGAYLNGRWHSGGSLGGQATFMMPGDDLLDLYANWYGGLTDPLTVSSIVTPYKGTFDAKIRYSHQLWHGGPDFRIALFGFTVDNYQKHVMRRSEGYGTQIGLASRDGRLQAFYDYEKDRFEKDVHTVRVSMAVGFSLEKLLSLQSPIEDPTPVFASPRHYEKVQAAPSERPLRKELVQGESRLGWGHCDCSSCSAAVRNFYYSQTWSPPIDLNLCDTVDDPRDQGYCPPCSWMRYYASHGIPNSSACDGCNMRVEFDTETFLEKWAFGGGDYFKCAEGTNGYLCGGYPGGYCYCE